MSRPGSKLPLPELWRRIRIFRLFIPWYRLTIFQLGIFCRWWYRGRTFHEWLFYLRNIQWIFRIVSTYRYICNIVTYFGPHLNYHCNDIVTHTDDQELFSIICTFHRFVCVHIAWGIFPSTIIIFIVYIFLHTCIIIALLSCHQTGNITLVK